MTGFIGGMTTVELACEDDGLVGMITAPDALVGVSREFVVVEVVGIIAGVDFMGGMMAVAGVDCGASGSEGRADGAT